MSTDTPPPPSDDDLKWYYAKRVRPALTKQQTPEGLDVTQEEGFKRFVDKVTVEGGGLSPDFREKIKRAFGRENSSSFLE